jgi:hypothetical protein
MDETISLAAGADKCRFFNPAMRSLQGRRAAGGRTKKRLHSRRVEPEDRTEVQIQSNGRWTREEDTPSAGWAIAEGGGFGGYPVSTDQGPREEERSGSTSTG